MQPWLLEQKHWNSWRYSCCLYLSGYWQNSQPVINWLLLRNYCADTLLFFDNQYDTHIKNIWFFLLKVKNIPQSLSRQWNHYQHELTRFNACLSVKNKKHYELTVLECITESPATLAVCYSWNQYSALLHASGYIPQFFGLSFLIQSRYFTHKKDRSCVICQGFVVTACGWCEHQSIGYILDLACNKGMPQPAWSWRQFYCLSVLISSCRTSCVQVMRKFYCWSRLFFGGLLFDQGFPCQHLFCTVTALLTPG